MEDKRHKLFSSLSSENILLKKQYRILKKQMRKRIHILFNRLNATANDTQFHFITHFWADYTSFVLTDYLKSPNLLNKLHYMILHKETSIFSISSCSSASFCSVISCKSFGRLNKSNFEIHKFICFKMFLESIKDKLVSRI